MPTKVIIKQLFFFEVKRRFCSIEELVTLSNKNNTRCIARLVELIVTFKREETHLMLPLGFHEFLFYKLFQGRDNRILNSYEVISRRDSVVIEFPFEHGTRDSGRNYNTDIIQEAGGKGHELCG